MRVKRRGKRKLWRNKHETQTLGERRVSWKCITEVPEQPTAIAAQLRDSSGIFIIVKRNINLRISQKTVGF